MKLHKNQIIKFITIDDLTGEEIELCGKIVADWEAIKRGHPEEYGGVDENSEVYLVDALHYAERFVVYKDEIIKILKKENSQNNLRL